MYVNYISRAAFNSDTLSEFKETVNSQLLNEKLLKINYQWPWRLRSCLDNLTYILFFPLGLSLINLIPIIISKAKENMTSCIVI